VNQKDIKLLWGRSANRCSICRIELSQDKKSVHASLTLGEQAHIVGEKDDAARGKSILSDEQRNSYHNIILLCPNHHTEIDKNEEDWPVERLHLLKSQHELWVRETLGDTSDPRLLAQQLAATTVIDLAVNLCDMENWKIWASNALTPSPRLPEDFPDRVFRFRQRIAAAIWPLEYEELKRATLTLSILIHQASRKFMEHAEEKNGFYLAHRFYHGNGYNPHFDEDVVKFENWLDEFYSLIKNATRAANWFADVVRRDINPMFFVEKGKFLVVEGLFTDLYTYASVPEFEEVEKALLPNSFFSKHSPLSSED
jgi:hypothetical protein